MKITYDHEVDALYIRFLDGTVTTQHLAGGLAVDYDEAGRLAGIEVLDCRREARRHGVAPRGYLQPLVAG